MTGLCCELPAARTAANFGPSPMRISWCMEQHRWQLVYIDLDGRPEIVVAVLQEELLCFEHDGSLKWLSDPS